MQRSGIRGGRRHDHSRIPFHSIHIWTPPGLQAFFSSIAAVGERSCSHISGLLVRPWSPLALMEIPRVFISIRLPASKGPWMERIAENTGPTALPSL